MMDGAKLKYYNLSRIFRFVLSASFAPDGEKFASIAIFHARALTLLMGSTRGGKCATLVA